MFVFGWIVGSQRKGKGVWEKQSEGCNDDDDDNDSVRRSSRVL